MTARLSGPIRRGTGKPGKRAPAGPDPFEPFVAYVTARLGEDPHLWSQTLFDELGKLGFTQSYPTLTRQIRARGLRPACTACSHVTQRPNAVIAHPPGEETQFDWLELPDAPAAWGFPTSRAFLLVGSLPYSGRWRAAVSPSMDAPHLLAAMTTVVTALGGVSRQWRFDRMRTVLDSSSRKITASFAAFAKHYGVTVEVCRPRSGNRKGVVEKNNHTAAVPTVHHAAVAVKQAPPVPPTRKFLNGRVRHRRARDEPTRYLAALAAAGGTWRPGPSPSR